MAKTALSRAMIIIMQANVIYTGYIYDNVPVLYCHDAMILSPKEVISLFKVFLQIKRNWEILSLHNSVLNIKSFCKPIFFVMTRFFF